MTDVQNNAVWPEVRALVADHADGAESVHLTTSTDKTHSRPLRGKPLPLLGN